MTLPSETHSDTPSSLHESSRSLVLMFCCFIAFAASVCIMTLELTASRLIAGHLGGSLYTWTAVIGVVLAGISIGNSLGGAWSDRVPPHTLLPKLFVVAGLMTWLTLLLNSVMALVGHPAFIPWPMWIVVSVAFIFLLPAIALGTISPVTANLALRLNLSTGATVGNVYAWGAAGSILGTFLTGFYLGDLLGTRTILLLVGAGLLALGAVTWFLCEWMQGEGGPAGANAPTIGGESATGRAATASLARAVSSPAEQAFLFRCYSIVFWANVCIMLNEMTVSRLISVSMGNSLYTWTSVIGVVLAGMTIGHYLGGWLADNASLPKSLGASLVIASVLAPLIIVLNDWAVTVTRPNNISWQMWVLLFVMWLVFLPSIALGAVAPLVASLAVRNTSQGGRTIGNVYACAAIGSIVGTFLAGYWLIDWIGVKLVLVTSSLITIVLAAMMLKPYAGWRSGLVFGMAQLVLIFGLLTAVDASKMKSLVGCVDFVLQAMQKKGDAPANHESWADETGLAVQKLGKLLRLRSDEPVVYSDESNYYSVRVQETFVEEESARELLLDHLIHAYYSPENPTKLYYDYEKVYAAVMERTCLDATRTFEVPLATIPAEDVGAFTKGLPSRVTYDSEKKRLSVRGGLSPREFRDLLRIGPAAPFWQAVMLAHERSQRETGLIHVPLEAMPDGLAIDRQFLDIVQYDTTLQAIVCYRRFDLERAVQIMAVGPHAEYVRAAYELFGKSRQVSALFLGGGGFVYPRYVEVNYPYFPWIDVAEIDPAVKTAVQVAMGFPKDDFSLPALLTAPGVLSKEGEKFVENWRKPSSGGAAPSGDAIWSNTKNVERTWVRTSIGDARKFVQDRLRVNRQAQARKQPVVQYDYIYGDAFNDYCIPFHLTTTEFVTQVRDLLTPEHGLYMANIIDIYPRIEYPTVDDKVGEARVPHDGPLPEAFLPVRPLQDEWTPARSPFQYVQVKQVESKRKYQLKLTAPVPDADRDALTKLEIGPANNSDVARVEAGDDTQKFRSAIYNLAMRSNERRRLACKLPQGLIPLRLDDDPSEWVSCPDPFQHVQVKKHNDGLTLGFRGVMSGETATALSKLAPEDKEFQKAIESLKQQSRREKAGQFVGRYVATMRHVFPYVYVFSGFDGPPGDDRDTFVAVASLRKLSFDRLYDAGGFWSQKPFAWMERNAKGEPVDFGEMPALLEQARGHLLTDDFAPVDNLLAPVFVRQ